MKYLKLSICIFILLLFAKNVEAGKPTPYEFQGCVLNGRMLSEEGYQFHPFRPFKAARYEGKKIRVNGLLTSGDYYRVDEETLQVLGNCGKKLKNKLNQIK